MAIIRTTFKDINEPWILPTQRVYMFHMTQKQRLFTETASTDWLL